MRSVSSRITSYNVCYTKLLRGPLMHVIAAKAVAFKEALQPEFKQYARQVVSNAQALAAELVGQGFNLVRITSYNVCYTKLLRCTKRG